MSEKRSRMNRRQFLKGAAVAGAAAVAGFPTIVKASALGKDGAVAAVGPHRHGRHRLRHDGPGQHVELPREARGPVGRRLRPRHRAAGHGQGHGRQEVRQQGLRDLPRFPRALPAQGPRRRVHRRARPLARHPGHLGPAVRLRRLRRKAPDPQPARGPGPLRRRQALRPGLADGLLAALRRELPPGLRSSSATGASARSRGSRSACPPVITISPGPSARRRSSRRRRTSITSSGSGRRRGGPTARPAST